MKTLLVTLEYPPQHGGVPNYYGNIVKNWPNDKIGVLDNQGSKLELNALPKFKWAPAFISIALTTLFGGYRHLIVGEILPIGAVVYHLSKILRTKYTVVLHGLDFTLAMSDDSKRPLAEKILKGAENIVCANSYTAQLVREKFEDLVENIFVVHPGINPGEQLRFRDMEARLMKEHELEKKNVIFCIGRLVERKGFDKMIEAMPAIVHHISNTHLYLAGDGPDAERLHKLVEGLNEETREHIHFLGAVSDREKWTWLYYAKMLAMPARDMDGDYEGFGIVYLEANLAGKAVLAGRSGGVEDAVEDYETGILVDPENVDDIAAATLELLVNKRQRTELANYGRERAIDEFNWEKQARLFECIINKK